MKKDKKKTCPHCGDELKQPDPFYTLVSTDGKKQKIVGGSTLAGTGLRGVAEPVEVVCVEVRRL
jgi:hypothetical protein